jgi:hypothetical protein
MSQSHNGSIFQPCLEIFIPETRKLKRFYRTRNQNLRTIQMLQLTTRSFRHFGLLDSFHRTQIKNTRNMRMYSLLQVEVPQMNRVHTA